MRKYLFLIILCYIFLPKGNSQIPNNIPGGQRGGSNSPQQSDTEIKDTVPIFYFYKNYPADVLPYKDTMIGYDFMHYDPSKGLGHEWIHLGNIGSGARPVFFTPTRKTGLDIGLHAYDLYKKSFDQIRLFDLNTPITKLFFSQGQGQENSMMQGYFSRNFSKGIHVNMDYSRMNHQGIYIHQKNRHTALTSTIWIHHPRGRWDMYISYLYNKIEGEDNGGVETLESLKDIGNNPVTRGNRGVIDVFINNGFTRHRENGAELKLQYYLGELPTDTLQIFKKNQWLDATLSYHSRDYLSYDTGLDSNYYNEFYIDDRGLRSFIKHDQLSGSIHYAWKLNDSTYHKPFLNIGLHYDRNIISRDLRRSIQNNLYITGQLNKILWPGGEINGSLKSYFGANAGDLALEGTLSQKVRSHLLMANIQLFRFSPSLIEQRWEINSESFWNNGFNRPSYLKWAGAWKVQKNNSEIGIQNYILNNWIYFDDQAQPAQLENVEIVLGIYAEKLFKFGKWRSYNYILYQESTNDALPLPQLFAKTSIYLSTYIFKKALLIQPGLDLRWNSSYNALGYLPLLNQFHTQQQYDLGNYPLLDAYANFKVSRFRAFIKMENLTSYLTDDVYFHHALYPYFDAAFRFGISWEMRN